MENRHKALLFVSFHIKDNVEVILFNIKSRGVQSFALLQKTLKGIPQCSILKMTELLQEQQLLICNLYWQCYLKSKYTRGDVKFNHSDINNLNLTER